MLLMFYRPDALSVSTLASETRPVSVPAGETNVVIISNAAKVVHRQRRKMYNSDWLSMLE